ncbi:MAG: nucleotidyl transferase AbiEii/AbiGii toxin family protein [Gemmatimonadetes bacterium]|nr:nucleotidyl transferase AbiEii/AbiGii toxin family protein [Gemmatimonadota bacterium]
MVSPDAPDFERLIAAISSELRRRGLPYMLIGGQAVLLHGEPRLTRDIDITLGAGPDRAPDILQVCASLGLSPLIDDVARFVQRSFVLPAADEASGIRVDFVFSTTPYESEAIRRAVSVDLAGVPVAFASAEDLILHKLFAGRPRDVEDARGVVLRKGPEIDWDYVERWAEEFAAVPGREDLPERVQALRAESDQTS